MLNAELAFGSEKHKRIVDALLARVRMSEKDLEQMHTRWERNEKDFAFYMPEKDADTLRKMRREGGSPQYTTIEIPYTYAQMMAAHTYLCSVFLSRNPILQFQARHGEPDMNVQAVEALMDYQTQVGGHMAPYYVWLHDASKYGLGVICRYWDKEEHVVSEIVETPVTLLGQPVEGKTTKTKVTKKIVGYEGNRLFNVRPFDYLPDTRFPLSEPQKGEFCGRKTPISWNTIIRRKLRGQYINIDYVEKHMKTAGSVANQRKLAIMSDFELPDQNSEGAIHSRTSLVGQFEGIELVVEILPKEWELGSSEHPEKWVFTLLDRKVLIEARPYGMHHNKFPFEVIETEIEGYALGKRSMMDIGRPLNEVMTWLFNSHFYSVRKSLNGDIVYDPSRVVSSDLLNSNGTGSRIRLKPEHYGSDVRTAIHVLQGGADVTGTHLRDSEIVGQMLQRVLGVTDNILGSVNPGGRKTATEIRTASSSSVNRLRTIAEYISSHGFSPFTQQMLQTTQQMYSAEKKFRIVGDQVNRANQFIDVSPETIAGFFDYSPVDGTLPLDRFALVNMWTQLFAQVKQFPEVAQQYNLGEIFAWVAQLAGIKNIKQFKINLVPDGMVPPGSVPVGGPSGRSGGNSQSGGATRGGGDGGPVIPIPRQVPGVGSSG